MFGPWSLIGVKDFGRSVSPTDSPEEKMAFVLAFTGSWSSNLIGIVLLSGGGAILAVEEIWRSGYLVDGFLTVLKLTPWVVMGIAAGIFLGRWTTRRELTRIKENIITWSTKPRGLTLFECSPWIGFFIGFAICFGSGVLVRGILDLVPLVKTPALIWIATGTAVLLHGILHMLWWTDKRRAELLTLLCQALELEKSESE